MDNHITSANTAKLAKQNRTRAAIVGSVAILLLVGIVVLYLQHADSDVTKPVSISEVGQKEFNIDVDNGKLSKGPKVITVKKGDKVHIQYHAHNMGEADVRLAGYGLNSGLAGNGVTDMEFTASKSGTFPVDIRVEPEEEESAQPSATDHASDETSWSPLISIVVK